ncbi:MAG: hypothetical protein ACFE8N_10305 [Promethearchaeota archaeon]
MAIHRRLTQKQLRELSGYSLGTISKKLRTLVNLGVLKKERIPNSNEKVYILRPDIYQVVADTSWEEFEKITEFLNAKLLELEKFEDNNGFILLTERIKELLVTFDLIQNIWNDIRKYLFPQKKVT